MKIFWNNTLGVQVAVLLEEHSVLRGELYVSRDTDITRMFDEIEISVLNNHYFSAFSSEPEGNTFSHIYR